MIAAPLPDVCRKRAYDSRATALLDLDRIVLEVTRRRERIPPGKRGRAIRRAERAHPQMPCRTYRCAHCGAWHLTSQPLRP